MSVFFFVNFTIFYRFYYQTFLLVETVVFGPVKLIGPRPKNLYMI